MKNHFNKHIVAYVALIFGILLFLCLLYSEYLENDNIHEVSYFLFFATAFLAFIAYYEFQRANNLAGNEFVLYISNRWASPETIKARQIIHDIFIKRYRHEGSTTKGCYVSAMGMVSKDILDLSRKNGIDGNNFIYLLNLIDFLETISYFHARHDLSTEDIKNICGHNFVFLYKAFHCYKKQRQKHDKEYFKNIDLLYKQLDS